MYPFTFMQKYADVFFLVKLNEKIYKGKKYNFFALAQTLVVKSRPNHGFELSAPVICCHAKFKY